MTHVNVTQSSEYAALLCLCASWLALNSSLVSGVSYFLDNVLRHIQCFSFDEIQFIYFFVFVLNFGVISKSPLPSPKVLDVYSYVFF